MISAIVNTYNEEKNIKRCLASLGFASEIVVVDMGSTDKTCQIARQYKTTLYNHEYIGFVEPARNYAISKAKNEWILIVDADEEIPQALARYLVKLTGISDINYYRLARKNIIFDKWIKHSGWWPDYQVRFFKKGNVQWSDKIHGVPITLGRGMDIEPSGENLWITHYNYQSLTQYLERLNRYSSIMAKQYYLENKRFSIREIFRKGSEEFVSRFFIRKGYLDGMHGLALAYLQSISEVAVQLKLWELEHYKPENINLSTVEEGLTEEYKTKFYWLYNQYLSTHQSLFKQVFWRVKRKLQT